MANSSESSTAVIGLPEDRVDGRLKVTGGAKYSAEMPVAGVLHAVMVMSTIANGSIKSIDSTVALAHPGVSAVITPFNAPKVVNIPGQGGGAGRRERVLSILQDTNVYYQNQPISVVVAETLEAAQYGASVVKVDYTASKPATVLDRERDNAYPPEQANQYQTDSLRGTPATAITQAANAIKHVYETPYENHNPMEPHATIAIWDGDDKLTVYDATQGIFGVQSLLANVWGIPPANVRCITYFVGGGFGSKGSAWSHTALASIAAKAVGKPVKLTLSRQQMFGMVGYRPKTEQTIGLGANNDGALTAITHDVYTQTSMFDEFVEPSAVATRMLYSCPNVGTSHRLTKLNYGTPTYMRAPGESSGTFAIETAMDELAALLKLDPVALRLTNYADTDQDKNMPYSSKSLKECYRVGAAKFGWDQRPVSPGSKTTPNGMFIGYGLGTATYPANQSASSATVRIMPDGSAVVSAGTQDIGTGTYTVMRQIAADAIGQSYDRVTFLLGDTNMPKTPGSGGSTTAGSTGSAVLRAGQAAKRKVIQLAVNDVGSPVHGLDAANVDIKDGRIISTADSTVEEPISALVARQGGAPIETTLMTSPDQERNTYSTHSFGAVFTEVHVDPDFGMVRVARVVGVYGVGKRLNAKTARSQLIGGMVFGIGMALMEQTIPDENSGRIVNADLAEYHVPVNADVPPLDVVFVDEDDPYVNPLGIKGIGEIGITGIVASIGNAVFNATGVRVRSLPITLDKVMT